MSISRRKFTREFKVAAVKRLDSGVPAGRVAREIQVNTNQLHQWRRELRKHPNTAFSGEGSRRQEETRAAELERKIGQQAMEIDFLKSCLRRVEDLRMAQAELSNPHSMSKSGKSRKGAAR
jgi:transposase-like protein